MSPKIGIVVGGVGIDIETLTLRVSNAQSAEEWGRDVRELPFAVLVERIIEGVQAQGIRLVPTVKIEDDSTYACPHCHTVKPVTGVSYVIAEVPGMGQLVVATIYCGTCRLILATQILEMQTAALAAQRHGVDLGGAPGSGLWTPPGTKRRGN